MLALSPELLALFAAKSRKKKLFFSTWQGRRQMAVRLDDRDEGAVFVREIGGRVAQKTRRPPIGAWEWYYEGKGPLTVVSIAAQLHPILNWYQQQVTASWVAAQPTLPLCDQPVIRPKKKLTAKEQYYLNPGDETWKAAWREACDANPALQGGNAKATGAGDDGRGDGEVEGGHRQQAMESGGGNQGAR